MISDKTTVCWAILLGVLVTASNKIAAETPSPLLLVVLKDAGALVFVDQAARKVVGRVPVGEEPHDVEVSSDGKLAFVSNYGPQKPGTIPGRTISVIDVATQKELHRLDLGARSRPHGLWFAGGKLYFTAEGRKLIGSYDPGSNQVDWQLGTGQNRTHLVILSKDMNRIVTSNVESDSVSIIDRVPEPLDWNETVIKVGKRPEPIDLSPDGNEVWTSHISDGGISIIDVAAKKVIQTLPAPLPHPNRLKFTLDGKRVLLTYATSNTVVVLDAAERKEIKRLSLSNGPEALMMSPDGLYAYVSGAKDNYVAIIDLKTLEIADRIPIGPGLGGMALVEKR